MFMGISAPIDVFAERKVRTAAFLIWIAVGVAAFLPLSDSPGLVGARAVAWTVAFITFGVALWFSLGRGRSAPARTGVLLVLLQSAAALVMGALACTGLEGLLLVMTSAQLAALVPLPHALGWTLVQTSALTSVLNNGWPFRYAALWSLGHLGLQLFALFAVRTAVRESIARLELARLYAELRATHGLLIDGARTAERLRISRELHDAIGHHLTALSLNLEVATHAPREDARHHVENARGVTKQLLDEVRSIVTTMRDGDALDVAQALRTLVDGVPKPRVHLELSGNFRIDDPALAHMLLRLVQEIMTNTIKHAEATNLWIELVRDAEAVQIVARDDGRGTERLRLGHGLNGIRERLAERNGRVEIDSAVTNGFRIRAWVPLLAASHD